MAVFDYSADQNKADAIEDLASLTVRAQRHASYLATEKTNAETARDACYTKCKNALTALGETPPDPITELHRELNANGVWTGKIYVNEPLP